MILDFGVLKEDGNINASIRSIEKAIESENPVEFDYTDVDNHTSHRVVEPLMLAYKWYAWYLFGYCCEKKGYRLFRLSRISDLSILDKSFSIKHRNTDELMAEHESRDKRQYLNVKLRCQAGMKIAVTEAFPGSEISLQDDGGIIIQFHVPENERMWFAALLSFGDKITVLEPETLKEKLIEKANEILKLYKQ